MPRKAVNQTAHVADVLTSLEERKETDLILMDSSFREASTWLDEAMKLCKRKISELSDDSTTLNKKTKTSGCELQEPKTTKDSVSNLSLQPTLDVVSEAKGKLEVTSLKVEQLKKELRDRGLRTYGLKKDLVKRLQAALDNETQCEVFASSRHSQGIGSRIVKGSIEETKDPGKDDNVETKDDSGANTGAVVVQQQYNEKSSESASQGKGSPKRKPTEVIPMLLEKQEIVETQAMFEAPPPESKNVASKVSLQSGKHPSVLAGASSSAVSRTDDVDETTKDSTDIVKDANPTTVSSGSDKLEKTSNFRNESGSLDKAESEKVEPENDPEKLEKASNELKGSSSMDKKAVKGYSGSALAGRSTGKPKGPGAMVTPLAAFGKSSSKSAASSVSASIKASAEARKARLAEIRGKSKPITNDKSGLAVKDYTVSKIKMKTSKALDGIDEKRKQLNAQMRQKAADNLKTKSKATEKEGGSRPAAVEVQTNDQKNADDTLSTEISGTEKERERRQAAKEALTTEKLHSKRADGVSNTQSILKSIPRLVSTSTIPENNPVQEVRSPMDTYEMSDHEDDDNESDEESDYDDSKPKKRIPDWAQKQNLVRALQDQFFGGSRFDPDKIFPEVQTCNLEAIFDQKKTRYNRRTSSGDWTRDRVTAAETLSYKRNAGYSRA